MAGGRPEPADVWPRVFLARDTRESSPKLIAAMKRAFDIFLVKYVDFDQMTTP